MADNQRSLEDIYAGTAGGSAAPRRSLEEIYSGQKEPEPGLLSQAWQNLPSSAARFGESLVQPILHPIQTGEALEKLGVGALAKVVPGASEQAKQYSPLADAVGQYFVNRYGGIENMKKTFAEDPVGFLADFSTVMAPFSRLPGVAGRVSEIVSTITDPVKLATKVPQAVGTGAKVIGGLVTGKGGEGLGGIARSAYEDAGKAAEVERNLREPQVHGESIAERAQAAASKMYAERSAQYETNMIATNQSMQQLGFGDIDAAINQAHQIGQFQGRNISDIAGLERDLPIDKVKDTIERAVANWKAASKSNPRLSTAAGIDKLKQLIGNIKDAQTYGSPQWRYASDIYNATRNTIAKQDKAYGDAMRQYQEFSDQLSDITGTLSLRKGTSTDTTLRKLLSATRENVNTNFGQRLNLVEELNKRDPTILPALYGQAYSPLTAGGLARLGPVGTIGATLYEHGGTELLQNPLILAKILPMLLATSPRVWGEAALAGGRAARQARNLVPQQLIDAAGYLPSEKVLREAALAARAAGGPTQITIPLDPRNVQNAGQLQ